MGIIDIVKYLVSKGANTANSAIVQWSAAGWLEKIKESVANQKTIKENNNG